MAKLLVPNNQIPFASFHISSETTKDVFELGNFVAKLGYMYNARCYMDVDPNVPFWIVQFWPMNSTVKDRAAQTITVLNTQWVIWDGISSFIVKDDSEVVQNYQISDVPEEDSEEEGEGVFE